MKNFLLLFILGISLLLSAPTISTENTDKKDQAAHLFDNGEEEDALSLYKSLIQEHPEDVEIVWKTSMLYVRVGGRMENEDERDRYFDKALRNARKALSLDDSLADVHFNYAVVLGKIADHQSAEEAMEASENIRKHSEKALDLDPNHEGAMHVLGMWHKRMANLSFIERAAVNTLYGGVPESASNEKAEKYLIKAAESDPDMITYNLELARFLSEQGETKRAKQRLEKVIQMEPRFKDDPYNKKEAEELLSQLN